MKFTYCDYYISNSVYTATGAMDLKKNGKLGLLLFALHISSNAMGSGFGIIAGVTIKPGKFSSGYMAIWCSRLALIKYDK